MNKRIYTHQYGLESGAGKWDLGWRLKKMLLISLVLFLGEKEKN